MGAFLIYVANPWRKRVPSYKGESTFSFLGDALDYAMRPVDLITKATAQCGNIFSLQVLTVYIVWLRGNALNKVYLETREDVWSFTGGMGIFLNKIIDPGYWNHYRTLLSSLSRYVNRGAAQEYTRTVSIEETQKSAAEWQMQADLPLFEAVSFLVHKIIVRTLMGQDFYENNMRELVDLLHAMEADIGSLFSFVLPDWVPHPPAQRLKRARQRVKEIFLERLHQREVIGTESSRDLPDYIAFTMEDKSTAPLSDLMPSHHTLLMFAAHTSTAASISWSLISLLRHPEMLKRVTAELRANPDEDSILLQACIKESSRLYSGFQMLRLARKEVVIPTTKVSVPKGAVVSISPYSTHHDPANFPNPEEWDPERWITGSGDLVLIDNRSEAGVKFLPFGAGCHRCVGEKMASIMVSKTLASLLKDYDVEWANPEALRVTDFSALDFGKIGSPWLKGDVGIMVKKV
ncbi:cytochrome P450 4F8 [Ilyonectria robusta]|uniref:cytochrome P450 4F8 n=1 Tax=Ilyonectria robusta TaxID=1079257 RepID=UPI001E8E60B3|nr:cytochrome P450 4F8 [Ilyonectria robusta]KAH8699884.1 cytochrome P450 4F8 [Ilyonectria robusta]